VQRQRAGEFADFRVVAGCQPARRGAFARPLLPLAREFPKPQQSVLKHRQLIHIVVAIVEQPLNQFRIHARAKLLQRPDNHLLALIAGQRGNQILMTAHRLRQTVETCAVADEIGAHGDDDMNVNFRVAVGFEQNLHEPRRLIARKLGL
jgi:hypothetical protein